MQTPSPVSSGSILVLVELGTALSGGTGSGEVGIRGGWNWRKSGDDVVLGAIRWGMMSLALLESRDGVDLKARELEMALLGLLWSGDGRVLGLIWSCIAAILAARELRTACLVLLRSCDGGILTLSWSSDCAILRGKELGLAFLVGLRSCVVGILGLDLSSGSGSGMLAEKTLSVALLTLKQSANGVFHGLRSPRMVRAAAQMETAKARHSLEEATSKFCDGGFHDSGRLGMVAARMDAAKASHSLSEARSGEFCEVGIVVDGERFGECKHLERLCAVLGPAQALL